jgi:hypothetical protein
MLPSGVPTVQRSNGLRARALRAKLAPPLEAHFATNERRPPLYQRRRKTNVIKQSTKEITAIDRMITKLTLILASLAILFILFVVPRSSLGRVVHLATSILHNIIYFCVVFLKARGQVNPSNAKAYGANAFTGHRNGLAWSWKARSDRPRIKRWPMSRT